MKSPLPAKVRVLSVCCPRCDFKNPDGTQRCFGCGETIQAWAERRMVTARRARNTITRLNATDLIKLRKKRHQVPSISRPVTGPQRVQVDTEPCH